MKSSVMMGVVVCVAIVAAAPAVAEVGSAADRALALKAERQAAGTPAGVAAAARTVEVDCTRGKSIQRAIDRNESPLTVEIHGICQENVRIDGKRVTLRGADPATDGIQGVAAVPAVAALQVFHADGVALESLSVSNGPAIGVGTWFSHLTMSGVAIEGNAGGGLHASSGSFVNALEVTVSGNGGVGVTANRDASVFCTGCVVEDNAGFAASANLGGVLSLLDGTVSGPRGLRATLDSYADVDCISSTAPVRYPCSLNATDIAGFAINGGTVAFFGAGDFTGAFQAFDRAHVLLLGARQLAGGTTPGGGPRNSFVSQHSTLTAEPFFDSDGVAHESRIKGPVGVDAFSRALLTGETVVDGTLTCERAGDAWADPGVTVTAGGAIAGCEHAGLP